MRPGDLVAGRFELERAAGAGGMGTVYRALDRVEGGPVALKMLRKPSEDHIRRFAKEAEVLYKLRHPRIVRYIAHGRTESGELFLAMEWLEGESLSQRLRREALALLDAYRLALGAAEAIAVAHAHGILHRDIKPGNMFLAGSDIERIKLVDFGLARLERGGQHFTATGELLGTPGYMSPEQARGDRDVDARADVFSLGCVLFRCFTGRRAFEGDDALAVLAKLVLETPPRMSELRPGIPLELETLVARMLSKDRRERPADGSALVAELKPLAPLVEAARGVELHTPGQSETLPSITVKEQRVMCLVLARLDPGAGDAQERLATLTATLLPFGAQMQLLIDGTVLVTVGSGPPAEQAARAGRSAIAMRSVLGRVPIALAAGRGLVSRGALLGEAIDRAAALLAQGRTDSIRLDDAAAALMRDRFETQRDELGFFLGGAQPEDEHTRRLMGRPTACVGRARELRNLEALFEESVAEPVARAVLVTAPPGVGKSRLRYEFVHRMRRRGFVSDEDGDERSFQIWMGRGDPMSAGSAFGMIGAALRQATGVRAGESLEVRRKKLFERVARRVPHSEQRRVTEFLGELVGTPFDDAGSVQLRAARQDPMLMGDQMRRAFEAFLGGECRHEPVLLVLEDLHWGDLPSISFIDSALRNLRDEPLMVLAFARPEVHDLFPDLWAERDLQEIRLSRLTRKAGVKLVRQVLGDDVPEAIVERLVDQAEGNAFYLEELIRAVAEGKGDRLPDSVLAMVQARLEALEGEARRVLRAASVFGQVFWRGGIAALTGQKLDLDDWLVDLADRELVTRRNESKFPDDREYVFRHALVREAAYAALTENDRELGHRLAGRWLEDAGEDEAVVLAEHFERGDEGGRAVRWYRRAAEQALEGNALAEALDRAEKGVACGAEGEVLGELRLLQAEAHLWRSEFSELEQRATVAMRELPSGGTRWCKAVANLAVACRVLGNYDRLVEIAEQLSTLSPERSSRAAYVEAVARTAQQLINMGWTRHGDALLARVAPAQEQLAQTHPGAVARIQHARAFARLHAGDPGGYLSLCEEAARRYEEAGDLRSVANARVYLGFAYLEVGGYREAELALRDALAAAERMGLYNVITTSKHNLGMALARLGALDEAAHVEAEALRTAAAQGDSRIEGAARHYLAVIHLLRGELGVAEQEALLAAETLRVAPPVRAHALSTVAQIRLAQGRRDEALVVAEEAMALLESLGGIEEGEAAVRLVHAEALFASSREEEARVAIQLAVRRLHERAAKIADVRWRESFLERLVDNARTLALARQWQLPATYVPSASLGPSSSRPPSS